MKQWNEVTERERGWIEGLLSSHRNGKRGTINLAQTRIKICTTASATAHRLQELLGGGVFFEMKKRPQDQVYTAGAAAGSVYKLPQTYGYAWFAEGDDFDRAVERLDQLELPSNLRAGIDTYLAGVAA